MIANLQSQNMTASVFDKALSLPKRLMYKSMASVKEGESKKMPCAVTSLGLSIPFQPSMWEEKTIRSVWNYVLEIVQSELNEKCSKEYTSQLLVRLNKIFSKFDFRTLRKSLIVKLLPTEEKVIYVSFPLNPMAFLNESVSVFDLLANMQIEAEFYCFILNEGMVSLYDFNNGDFRKVYEENSLSGSRDVFQHASNTIRILNSNNEKPVFVIGSPAKNELFRTAVGNSKDFFFLEQDGISLTNQTLRFLVNEIIQQWTNWQSKFIRVKIHHAAKGKLISHLNAVEIELGKMADGLLLLDKSLIHELHQTGKIRETSIISDQFEQHIENFLNRGNRLELTEPGLLKDWGGIVLLPKQHSKIPDFRTVNESDDLIGIY